MLERRVERIGEDRRDRMAEVVERAGPDAPDLTSRRTP